MRHAFAPAVMTSQCNRQGVEDMYCRLVSVAPFQVFLLPQLCSKSLIIDAVQSGAWMSVLPNHNRERHDLPCKHNCWDKLQMQRRTCSSLRVRSPFHLTAAHRTRVMETEGNPNSGTVAVLECSPGRQCPPPEVPQRWPTTEMRVGPQ